MSQYISRALRKLVIERAGHRCEYCRVPEYLSGFDYHIEHIIGVQHGGTNTLDNLAYCCPICRGDLYGCPFCFLHGLLQKLKI